MLKIAVGVEVKTDQNRNDLRIGHHALSSVSGCIRRCRKGIFRHLNLEFFAKIIGNTENFSNFTSVIMIYVFKVGTYKLLNINDITKRIGSFFKLPIQLLGYRLSRTRVNKEQSDLVDKILFGVFRQKNHPKMRWLLS